MGNINPKVEIKYHWSDKVMEALSFLAIAFMIVFLMAKWTQLPDIIPSHFDAKGEVDGYGSKYTLFILIPTALVIYGGLTLLGRYPSSFNYIITITEHNAEVQFNMAVRLIRIMKLEILLMYSYIEVTTVLSAMGNRLLLGNWFLPVTLLMIFGTLATYIVASAKAK